MEVAIEFSRLRLPRKRFEIATAVREAVDVFIVEAAYGGVTGCGSGSPAQSMQDSWIKCEKALETARGISINLDGYFDSETNRELCDISPSAAAAVDIALWDLFAKREHVALARALGGNTADLRTGATVDLKPPKEAAEEARTLISQGFNTLKVKAGGDPGKDARRVEAVRTASGNRVEILVDANGGFDLEGAGDFLRRVEPFSISLFEQPVPRDRVDDLADLSRIADIPICADESVRDLDDLKIISEKKAADVINIKLMKCGGLTPAIEMCEYAKKRGIGIMLGCMGDIGLSIAASAHLACAVRPKHLDLDSHLNIERICTGPAVKKGAILIGEDEGLGVALLEGWTKWRA